MIQQQEHVTFNLCPSGVSTLVRQNDDDGCAIPLKFGEFKITGMLINYSEVKEKGESTEWLIHVLN